MHWTAYVPALAVTATIAFAGVGAAPAQTRDGGCTIQQVGGTARQALRCRSGLSAVAEAGAQYAVLDRNRDGNADSVQLTSGGLLLDVEHPTEESRIEVIAPQAIAAVRGTKWAVDAQPGRTSVFVVRGSVSVRKPTGGGSVVLGPGDGVDVDGSAGELVVRQWPAARVAALLARFGQ